MIKHQVALQITLIQWQVIVLQMEAFIQIIDRQEIAASTMHVSEANILLALRNAWSILQSKNEISINFVVLLGSKMLDDILSANLVSISGEDCHW